MGMYNVIQGTVDCPRCGALVTINAKVLSGDEGPSAELAIGDPYPFKSGTLEGSALDWDAYADCPACLHDFGLRVRIENRIIKSMKGEPRTLAHERDGTLFAEATCPNCGSPQEKEIALYNGCSPGSYRLGDSYPPAARHVGPNGWIRGRAKCEGAACVARRQAAEEYRRPMSGLFAVKIFLRDGQITSVTVDPNQLESAEDIC